MIGRAATVDKEHTVRELRRQAAFVQVRRAPALRSYRDIYFFDVEPAHKGPLFTEEEARLALLLAADAIEAGDLPAWGDW